jgi:hypoxanthine phosphoribosyltransferase
MDFLKDYLLKEKKAKSLKICSLLSKPSRRKIQVKIDYLGFNIPDKFVAGYGLDHDGKYIIKEHNKNITKLCDWCPLNNTSLCIKS